MIHQPFGQQVNDFPFALQYTEDAKQAGGEEFAALAFGEVGVDDDVGEAGFVFDRQEDDAAGGAGALAAGDDAGAAGWTVVFQRAQRGGGEVALFFELAAQQGERVAAEREAERTVVGDEVFAFAGGSERRGGFADRGFEQ